MVCVFTASAESIAARYLDLATAVGAEIGRRGMGLVTGGGSISTMGAVARAVRANGGHTVGVIPRGLFAPAVADHESDELFVTSDMRQRKALMDSRADAFLALPGGLGTLEELLEAWVGRVLSMHRKPVVILDPWSDLRGLRELIETLCERGFVAAAAAGAVNWSTSVPDAFDLVEANWDRDSYAASD